MLRRLGLHVSDSALQLCNSQVYVFHGYLSIEMRVLFLYLHRLRLRQSRGAYHHYHYNRRDHFKPNTNDARNASGDRTNPTEPSLAARILQELSLSRTLPVK